MPNVLLPDSNIDLRASQGVIRYKVKLDSLPELERHSSFANIYFDFNTPVTTNSVYHTITTDFFYDHQQVTICEGEVFRNRVFHSDTTVRDTLVIPGPDSIITTHITVEPQTFHPIDTLICPGTVILKEGRRIIEEGEYYFAYSIFEDCDSVVILNITFKDYKETHIDTTILPGKQILGIEVFKDTTLYRLIESEDYCSDVFYHIKIITTSPSINDKEGRYVIYPNPAQDILYITSDGPKEAATLPYRILDSRARILLSSYIKLPHASVRIDDLASGLYYVEIIHKNGTSIHPFIKQ